MKNKYKVISLLLALIIFLSLILASCNLTDSDPGGSGGDLPENPGEGGEGGEDSGTPSDGILISDFSIFIPELGAGVVISELFVGLDKLGSPIGEGSGTLTADGEERDVLALCDGAGIFLYDKVTDSLVFSLSLEELNSVVSESYGVDLEKLLLGSDSISSELSEWYNTDFIGAVGNVNFAVITAQINKLAEAFRDRFITGGKAEDGAYTVIFNSEELSALIDSYAEKTAYEVINEAIRSALAGINKDELPEKVNQAVDKFGIENIKLEDTVAALLPYSLSDIIIKFRAAGGKVDKLVDALDKLASILTDKDSISALVSELFGLSEPVDLKEILTGDEASSLTVGELLKSIYNVGDTGLSFKLSELYAMLKNTKLYEFLGISDVVSEVSASLKNAPSLSANITLTEGGDIKSLEIKGADGESSPIEIDFKLKDGGVYEFLCVTELFSIGFFAKEAQNYVIETEKLKPSAPVLSITEELAAQKYGQNKGYTTVCDTDGNIVSVSYEIYDDSSPEGASAKVYTVYFDRTVAYLCDSEGEHFVLITRCAYPDAKEELSTEIFIIKKDSNTKRSHITKI